VTIEDGAMYLPEPMPCDKPLPPPMPDLIRIDTAKFLAANAPVRAIPTMSPAMLIALGLALALATIRHVRS
jgi:hypothetical protein